MSRPALSRSAIIGAATLMLVATSGCARLQGHQGYVGDATLLSSVQPGVDNKASVETTLGRPTFVGQFGDKDWYYFARDTRQLAFSSPKPTAQFVLHVQFDKAGNVASVSQGGMENVRKISPNGDRTPTLGRHSSFFEDLFGNVGTVGAGGGAGAGGHGGSGQ